MDPVQQIKERLNIVEVIGQYVKLTKAGKNYKGLSPFRKEKTPSFYVSPDKGMYYDFSSGQGGDVFTFMQTMEGLDFKGALTMLAERAGVELHRESRGARDARDRLYDVLEEACRRYETALAEHADARAYLAERGLEPGTMRAFRLGFAAEGWTTLGDTLTRAGYDAHDLETAGLTKRGERGGMYDRFRSRIMFPLTDPAGRVIGFSGRIFGEAARDDKNAKYLNSPETPLFEKGRVLYGYDKAKASMRKYGCAILVEGQMDLVMSHQAGYANTVAVSGTGLTDDHLALVQRLTNNLVLAFDADTAGVASNGRAAALALGRGMDVKVVRIPLGKDPADCIREDVEVWKRAVRESVHVVDFYLDRALDARQRDALDERGLVLHVRDSVLPFVVRVPSATDQAHFVRTIAQRLGIAEDAVWRDVRQLDRRDPAPHTAPVPAAPPPPPQAPPTTREESAESALAGFLFWQAAREPRILDEARIAARAGELEVDLAQVLARHAAEREALAFRAELAHSDTEDPYRTFDALLSMIARGQLVRERQRLTRAIKDAERTHDEEGARTLLTAFHALARRIEALPPAP